jgi:hypothetical protein
LSPDARLLLSVAVCLQPERVSPDLLESAFLECDFTKPRFLAAR